MEARQRIQTHVCSRSLTLGVHIVLALAHLLAGPGIQPVHFNVGLLQQLFSPYSTSLMHSALQ